MINIKKQIRPAPDNGRYFAVPYIQRWYSKTRQTAQVADETCTDTSFGNDTDINNIVERFQRTGHLPVEPETRPAQYADVTELQEDLDVLIAKTQQGREAMSEILKAQQDALDKQEQQDKADLEDFRRWKAQRDAQNNDGAEAPSDGTPPPS